MEINEEKKTPWVFEIPERNFPKLEETISKMVRRARKCTLPPPRLEVIWEADEQRTKSQIDRVLDPTGTLGIYETIEYLEHYFYVVVAGEKPRIRDWDFVATIEHGDEVGNLVKSVPGSGQIPVVYRQSQPVCQHCNTARKRIETFVLRNAKDGTYKQVGRNCLQDFFDGESPAQIAQLLEWWTQCVELLMGGDEDDFSVGGGWARYPIEFVLKMTQAIIDCVGWMSKTKARELHNVEPTSSLVIGQLSTKPSPAAKELAAKLVFKDEYDQMVADALEWVRGLDPEKVEDYLYNLHVISKGETVRQDRLGLACSLMPAYRRHLNEEFKKQEFASKKPSEHIGTVGERAVFDVVVEYIAEPTVGSFGATTRVVYKDAEGNKLVWWSSGEAVGKQGEALKIVGSVKKHEVYQGQYGPVKQTIITRVKEWDGKPLKKPKAKKGE